MFCSGVEIGTQLAGGGRRAIDDLVCDRADGTAKWQLADEQFVENDSEGELIGGGGGFLRSIELLGGHIRRRAENRAAFGEPGAVFVCLEGEAEVHDDWLAARIDHDVRRLQVTMDDAGGMGLPKCDRNLANQDQSGLLLLPPGRLDELGERPAVDECHGDVMHAGNFADIIHRTEVGISNRRREPAFPVEPLEPLIRIDSFQLRNLEGDLTGELRILR